MFEDFDDDSAKSADDRKRMGTSMLASGGVLLLLGAIGATMAVTTTIVRRHEPEVEVTFEDLSNEPPPPPPPPRPEVPPPPRPNRPAAAVVRQEMANLDHIPDEVPAESDAALADAGDTGPLEGELGGSGDGDGDGTGPAVEAPPSVDEEAALNRIPQLAHADVELPQRVGGCERPEYPQEARAAGLTDRVVVRVRINEDGTIGTISFERGDPVFHDAVRRCVEAMQWRPARLADGTAIAHARMLTFPFRLNNF